MLEKTPSNVNVLKLKAILLLEADFNAVVKLIFNSRFMSLLERKKVISIEIIG